MANRDEQPSAFVGWPMALAVGKANSRMEFVFPTSEEMGHPQNTTRAFEDDRTPAQEFIDGGIHNVNRRVHGKLTSLVS